MDLRPVAADPFDSWDELAELRDGARERGIEGLMLKRADSALSSPAGRRGRGSSGSATPLTLDAVLMYAQRGHGKRSSFYSDYTFGVWREGGDELVPVGKAYSGFTDEELAQLDKWVRNHTVDRFGPVREVEHGAGAGGRLRQRAALDPAQVRRRHALPAHPPHPLGQAAARGRPAGDAGGLDRKIRPRKRTASGAAAIRCLRLLLGGLLDDLALVLGLVFFDLGAVELRDGFACACAAGFAGVAGVAGVAVGRTPPSS